MKKILIIGIGAGDPDYITVQGINALNRADVFARNVDNELLQNTWRGSGFSGWSVNVASANMGSAATAISTGVNQLDVFFYDATVPTHYTRRHFDGTAWSSDALGRLFCTTSGLPVVAASWADSASTFRCDSITRA